MRERDFCWCYIKSVNCDFAINPALASLYMIYNFINKFQSFLSLYLRLSRIFSCSVLVLGKMIYEGEFDPQSRHH